MGIQIRSFVYLIIFIKWKCLNFYLVYSFEVSHSKQLLSGYLERKSPYFSANFLLFLKYLLIFMIIQIR